MERVDFFLRGLGMDVCLVGQQRFEVFCLAVYGRHVQRRLAKVVQRIRRLAKLELLEQGRVVIGGGQFVQGACFHLWRCCRLGYWRRFGLRLLRAAAGLSKRNGGGKGGQKCSGKVGWVMLHRRVRCRAGFKPRHPSGATKNRRNHGKATIRKKQAGRLLSILMRKV